MIIHENLKEIKSLKQWLGFKFENRNGKTTKPPMSPNYNGYAKTNDPSTWGTYEEAVKALEKYNYKGVGFVLAGGYFGIDLDHVIEDGKLISKEAQDIISIMDSYTEVSPSGTGIHIIAKGTIPKGKNKNTTLGFEIYKTDVDDKGAIISGRYFTMTGKTWGKPKPIAERTAQAVEVFNKYFMDTEPKQAPRTVGTSYTNNASVEEVLSRMLDSGDNRAINLFNGRLESDDISSETLALCNKLAYWTNGDAMQIDELFRRSALYDLQKTSRGVNKWDAKHVRGLTYGEATINKALESFTPYTPNTMYTRNTNNTQSTQVNPVTGEVLEAKPVELKTIYDLKDDFFNWVDEDRSQKVKPCYIDSIDKLNGGGLPVGLSMLMGESSVGKTALALNMAENMARKGEKVIFFSTEMPRNVCIARGISRLTKSINYTDIILKKVNKEEYIDSANEYFNTCGKNLIFIECYGGTTPNYIEQVIKEQGAKVVFIDYLQQLNTNDGKQYDERIKMKRVATDLLKICNELAIAMVVLSSVSRENYGKRLGIESGKESGELEFNASMVMAIQYTSTISKDLNREERENEKNRPGGREVTITILKNRLTSGTGKANFIFEAGINTFKPGADIDNINTDDLAEKLEAWKKSNAKK